MLGFLAEESFLGRQEGIAGNRFKQSGEGNFEGRTAGKTSAERNVRQNKSVEGGNNNASIFEAGNDPRDIAGPTLGSMFIVQSEANVLLQVVAE